MKKLILGLALTLSSFAFAEKQSMVFPQVYNFGSSIQVNVWNTTDKNFWCNGSVTMYLDNGKQESEYYTEFVSSRYNSIRMIYPREFGTRITSYYHNIWCN